VSKQLFTNFNKFTLALNIIFGWKRKGKTVALTAGPCLIIIGSACHLVLILVSQTVKEITLDLQVQNRKVWPRQMESLLIKSWQRHRRRQHCKTCVGVH